MSVTTFAEFPTILLVDDDKLGCASLRRVLLSRFAESSLEVAHDAQTAHNMAALKQPHVIVLDLTLDRAVGPESGLAVLKELSENRGGQRIIVLTGHAEDRLGIQALRLGAASFLAKPVAPDLLLALVEDGIQQACLWRRAISHNEPCQLSPIEQAFPGSSVAISEFRSQIQHAISSCQPLLLLGETGSGKTRCARMLHRFRKGDHRPFVQFLPSFGSPDLILSELFGHISGAFTGAVQQRQGLLTRADGGTLFIDEVDMLPHQSQVMLLGVVEEGTFRPVGSSEEMNSDFSLITASNRDLSTLVGAEGLRSDFYHRCAHLVIRVPALRERLEDLPLLARAYLAQLGECYGGVPLEIEESALAALKSQPWPGNMRQFHACLESAVGQARYAGRAMVIERDLVLADSPRIDRYSPISERGAAYSPVFREAASLKESVDKFKSALVRETLDQCENKISVAARRLKVDRTTVMRILKRG